MTSTMRCNDFFSTGLLLLAACFFLLSCTGRPTGQSQFGIANYTRCNMPSDQGQGSLVGSWTSLPIPIVFDRDFYLSNDGAAMTSLRNAVDTWNDWAVLKGHSKAFTIQSEGAGEVFPTITDCSQTSITGSLTTAVGIWKVRTSGPGRNRRDACSSAVNGGKLMDDATQGVTDWTIYNGKITGASIMLNFDAWNVPGKSSLDVESLLLHELGHLLGLLHSCSGTADRTSAPNCGSPSTPIRYLQAVMFPYLNATQLRRILTQNDYDRVNCLPY